MSPENEGPNSLTILEIDTKSTKKKKWLNMNSTQNDEDYNSSSTNANNGNRNGNNGNSNMNINGTNNDNNGNGKLNGHNNHNNAVNVIGVTNGFNRTVRRDSSHVLSPLLQTTDTPVASIAIFPPNSNNNEWKGTEEINNLKNGLHKSHGNNNGSLMMNGKNGIGQTDHYDEQDPLTGLYKQRPNKDKQIDDDDTEPSCGIFGFRPNWAKNFASTHMFMVVFLLAWILQGMYLTYFVSVITTIEKLFQIKSRTTGLLLSASEMGQISTAMLLTYFAGRGHRPRWIALGMVLFSFAAFTCALPHFIFGEQLLQSTELMNGGGNSIASHSSGINSHNLGSMSHDSLNLCNPYSNLTNFDSDECEENMKIEQASHSKITVIVLCILFVSLLSSGVGQTAVSTLGIPYIDDNVASRESPIYLAITIGVRILGPATGFIVGSFCTRIYVNFGDPGFDASDPRWISAWWLGPVMIGTLMLLASIAMFSFPKTLRGSRIEPPGGEMTKTPDIVVEPEEKPKLKDFPKTVRRQLSNDILMFRTASCVFHLLPIAGLYTFLPKYLETQFRLPASDANLITAFGGILVMGIGIVISGIVILKMNPSAKSVAAWIAFTALVYSCGMLVLMFVGCNMDDFAGLQRTNGEITSNFQPTCNTTCNCDLKKFAPICGADGKTYFSSCHAGCTTSFTNDSKTMFTNCDCIPDFIDDSGIGFDKQPYEAVSGYCDSNCKNFILFICIFAFCVFMHSTSEVGSMLVIMRCTHPKDKAMALGVIQSAIGLFGNVPCPIIYGAVVDSACLVWKTVCGKHGACSLYDVDTFRHYFLGITAGIMFLAFLMDLIVWSKAHRIDIAPEEAEKTETDYEKPLPTPDTTV